MLNTSDISTLPFTYLVMYEDIDGVVNELIQGTEVHLRKDVAIETDKVFIKLFLCFRLPCKLNYYFYFRQTGVAEDRGSDYSQQLWYGHHHRHSDYLYHRHRCERCTRSIKIHASEASSKYNGTGSEKGTTTNMGVTYTPFILLFYFFFLLHFVVYLLLFFCYLLF